MLLIQQPNAAEREILCGFHMLSFQSLESLKNPNVCLWVWVCVGVSARSVVVPEDSNVVNCQSLVGPLVVIWVWSCGEEDTVAGSWTEDGAAGDPVTVGEGDSGRGPGLRWDHCCAWGLSDTAARASLFGVLLRMSRLRRLEEMTSAMNLVQSAQTSRSVQPWAYRWGNSSSTERRDKLWKGLREDREARNVSPWVGFSRCLWLLWIKWPLF